MQPSQTRIRVLVTLSYTAMEICLAIQDRLHRAFAYVSDDLFNQTLTVLKVLT